MLETTQPLATQMSGSGSSLFAIYETTAQRDKAYNSLQNSKPERLRVSKKYLLKKN